MSPRRLLSAAAVALLTALAVFPASPAAAASGTALASLDGINFSQAPSGTLFNPNYRLIPGDHLTGTLWIKNDTSSSARVTFAVTNASGAPVLLNALKLVYSPSAWVPVAATSGQCGEMVITQSLAAGAVTRVDLSLDVDPNLAQGQTSGGQFAVRAMLDDPSAPAPGGSACQAPTVVSAFVDPGTTQLSTIASTGFAPLLPVSLAGCAVVLGSLLAICTRRERKHA